MTQLIPHDMEEWMRRRERDIIELRRALLTSQAIVRSDASWSNFDAAFTGLGLGNATISRSEFSVIAGWVHVVFQAEMGSTSSTAGQVGLDQLGSGLPPTSSPYGMPVGQGTWRNGTASGLNQYKAHAVQATLSGDPHIMFQDTTSSPGGVWGFPGAELDGSLLSFQVQYRTA